MKKISTLLLVLVALLTIPQVANAYDVEAATIAEFNAVEDGKEVKLTLTDARVNAFNDIDRAYYVEDATGATVVKGIALTAGTKLNGYIVGKKSTTDVDYVNDPSEGLEYALTVVDASQSAFEATATELVGTTMTIAEVAAQANYGRLITLRDVDITPLGNGMNKQISDAAGNTIKARDLFGVLSEGYEWPNQASEITGVVLYYMTGWFLIPISADAIVPYVQPTTVTFDFTYPNFREEIGDKVADPKGNIINEMHTIERVTLQITAGSSPAKLYKDATRGQNLAIYKEYSTLTFRAPKGYAITDVDFIPAGTSDIKSFTASSGEIDKMKWMGNAEGVRFLQGATSNLASVVVTLAEKNAETLALAPIEYTECANINAFNQLPAGSFAKVTLTDAEVLGVSADGYSTVWIQDATGGCWLQYTSLNTILKEKVGSKISGYVYVAARPNSGNVQMKETEDTPISKLTATELSEYTIVEGTLAEVNVAANKNKLVKITGATFTATSATAGTLTQGDASIAVNNGAATANQLLHKITETWVKDETKMENVTIVAILVGKSATENQLLPISMTAGATGIENIQHSTFNVQPSIYNLQGIRLNGLQKGLNIVNGKKVLRP